MIFINANWREEASALFFIKHLKISEIADILNLRRETISRYIAKHIDYDAEIKYRKNVAKKKRKAYKKDWDRKHRHEITGESLKREHETAVKVLSAEIHF